MNLALHSGAVGTLGSACLLAADRLSRQRQQLSKSAVIQMRPNSLRLATGFRLRSGERKVAAPVWVPSAATEGELKAISNPERGFVRETERIRVQRVQLEIRCLVPQPAEFGSEIEMGGCGYIQTGAVQKHPSCLCPDTRRGAAVDWANDSFGLRRGQSVSSKQAAGSARRRSDGPNSRWCVVIPRNKDDRASTAFQKRSEVLRYRERVHVAAADLREVRGNGRNSAADRVFVRVATETVTHLQRARRIQM